MILDEKKLKEEGYSHAYDAVLREVSNTAQSNLALFELIDFIDDEAILNKARESNPTLNDLLSKLKRLPKELR